MPKRAVLEGTEFPAGSRVSFKIEVSAEINITAYAAKQKANRFLIVNVGDQFHVGDPELVVGEEVFWRLPVYYAPSRRGSLGVVGHLEVNANTGEISIANGQTTDDLLKRAEALYARATL